MFKSTLLVILVLISASGFNLKSFFLRGSETVSAIPWPFTVCGDKGDWTIESLTLGSTPKRNTNDDITVTGTADSSVSFKQVILNVKLNGVFLDKETIDFDSSYDGGDSVEFKFQNYVPSFAPPGTYLLTFEFNDTSDKVNGCL